MQYTHRTVTVRWEGKLLELGTVECPVDRSVEHADTAFVSLAEREVEPCFQAFTAEMPPQPKFLLVIRALVTTYLQTGRDEALESRLAVFYMRLNWQTWCALMDPEGALGPPPPSPYTN